MKSTLIWFSGFSNATGGFSVLIAPVIVYYEDKNKVLHVYKKKDVQLNLSKVVSWGISSKWPLKTGVLYGESLHELGLYIRTKNK